MSKYSTTYITIVLSTYPPGVCYNEVMNRQGITFFLITAFIIVSSPALACQCVETEMMSDSHHSTSSADCCHKGHQKPPTIKSSHDCCQGCEESTSLIAITGESHRTKIHQSFLHRDFLQKIFSLTFADQKIGILQQRSIRKTFLVTMFKTAYVPHGPPSA